MRVDCEHALDVFGFLLDVVGVEGTIGRVADIAFPVEKVRLVILTNDHRVGQTHLLDVGERGGESEEKEGRQKQFHLFGYLMVDN